MREFDFDQEQEQADAVRAGVDLGNTQQDTCRICHAPATIWDCDGGPYCPDHVDYVPACTCLVHPTWSGAAEHARHMYAGNLGRCE